MTSDSTLGYKTEGYFIINHCLREYVMYSEDDERNTIHEHMNQGTTRK